MSTPSDKDQFQTWAREQLQVMARHLGSHGLVVKDEISVEAKWNYPFRLLVAVAWGKKSPNEKFWVVAGDVPTDHAELKLAPDARAALRLFALRWQIQGARVKSADRDKGPDANSKLRMNWAELGDSLADKAEFIYALAEDDRNWDATLRL
jgi:hypothetical protein